MKLVAEALAFELLINRVDAIRDRFGWEVIFYASSAFGAARSVPDDFRSLAEKEL